MKTVASARQFAPRGGSAVAHLVSLSAMGEERNNPVNAITQRPRWLLAAFVTPVAIIGAAVALVRHFQNRPEHSYSCPGISFFAASGCVSLYLLKVLLLLVKNPRGEWELPGGRPEEGEDHAKALAREFAEELSLDVRISGQIDSYLFEVIPGRHVFIITYGCTLAGEFRPQLSDEHTEHCLRPVQRLSEIQLPVGYRRSIEAWHGRNLTKRCS